MKLILTLTFNILSFCGIAQTNTSYKLLTFTKGNYRIQYPSTWTLDTSKNMGTSFYIFSPKENEEDKFRENINLVVQDFGGQSIDLDQYAQISEGQIKTMTTDGEIFESKKNKTDKTEYYKLIWGMTQGIFKVKTEQYYFIKNGKAFVLTFSSELKMFDKFKTVGEQILNSFELTK